MLGEIILKENKIALTQKDCINIINKQKGIVVWHI
jgi:hypothetical protein